jgi:hypothetical protein
VKSRARRLDNRIPARPPARGHGLSQSPEKRRWKKNDKKRKRTKVVLVTVNDRHHAHPNWPGWRTRQRGDAVCSDPPQDHRPPPLSRFDRAYHQEARAGGKRNQGFFRGGITFTSVLLTAPPCWRARPKNICSLRAFQRARRSPARQAATRNSARRALDGSRCRSRIGRNLMIGLGMNS